MIRCTALLLMAGLAGCASTPSQPPSHNGAPGSDRYSIDQDTGPDHHRDVSALPDPMVRDEPLSKYGNGPTYQVYGKTYTVMNSASGYVAEGIASWYGKKFHGHRTSSGETYDMYQLSAAHKTLPLPTWVRVTNLANGSSTVVRVNDRGPFHDQRLIDLSWAAAVKLGIDKTGTGRVRIEALSTAAAPGTSTTVAAATPSPPPAAAGLYLQLGAFRAAESAQQLLGELLQTQPWPVSIHQASDIFRVWIGPFGDESDRLRARDTLNGHGYRDIVNAP